MGQTCGQSPEMLFLDRNNFSNFKRKDKDPCMSMPLNQDHYPTFPMPEFTSHVQCPANCSPVTIPFPPLLSQPHNANMTGITGIMPLANFNFRNNNHTPSKKINVGPLNFNMQSPKISPLHITQGVLTQPNYQEETSIYHFGRVDRPKVPWLVPTFVVIHALIFLVEMYENNCPHTSLKPSKCVLRELNRLSFQPLNENPLLGPSYKALLSMGALESDLVTRDGQGWRLLTCMWLHVGLFHLLANMAGLLLIGLRLERDFGWVKVGTIYITTGLGGSLLSALFLWNQVSVGASGAVMGLLGATFAEILTNWTSYQNRNKSLAVLLLTVAVNLSFGIMPHVDNFAHIGGLFSGFLLGFICLMRPQFAWVNQAVHDLNTANVRRLKHTRMQIAMWFLALGLFVLCYSVAMLALFKDYGLQARRACKWCHYMSCVPAFLWQCRNM